MESFAREIRLSVRRLWHRPVFTGVVIATLGLGIGASTAIFSAVNAVLFRALPFADAGRLAMIWSGDPALGADATVVAYPDYADWKAQSSSWTDMTAFNISGGHLTGNAEPEEVWGAVVTPNFFSVVGVTPAIGRTFDAGAPASAADSQSIVISHRLWQRRFAGERSAVGTKLLLSGKPYTIVGVLPSTFRHPEPYWQKDADFWRPLVFDPEKMKRNDRSFRVLARLRPGVHLRQAQTEMREIARRLEVQFPDTNQDRSVYVVALRTQLFGDLRLPLLILFATAGVVLAIACGNVASLQIARANWRQGETAVRVALGAQPAQVFRQSVAESLVLAFGGGGTGLLLAIVGTRLLVAVSPADTPGLQQASIDAPALGFATLAALLSTFLTGVLPALKWSRLSSMSALASPDRTGTSSSVRMAGSLLAVAEIALALPLLIGAGLLSKSAAALEEVDAGFRPERLLSFRLSLPARRYPESPAVRAFYIETLQRLEHLPGVRSAGLVSTLPLTGLNDQVRGISYERQDAARTAQLDTAHYRVVGGDYFATMGIPVLEGRTFDLVGRPEDESSVVVSHGLARKLWPGVSALGKRLRLGDDRSGAPWLTVAGVVGDVRDSDLRAEPSSMVYLPHSQDAWRSMALVLRSESDPQGLTHAIKQEIWNRDPELPLADLQTMDQVVNRSKETSRFHAFSVALLAVLALALALIGVFGVISYTISERTHEFGIRMVLGARRGDVMALVLRYASVLAASGLMIGLLFALSVTRVLTHLLYGISSTDSFSFLGSALLLFGASLLAAWLPARRATRVEPMNTLRQE